VEDLNRNIKDKFEDEEAFDQRQVVLAGRICKGMSAGVTAGAARYRAYSQPHDCRRALSARENLRRATVALKKEVNR
jgi:hypothetical protein